MSNKTKLDPKTWGDIELLYCRGTPIREIAEQFGVKHPTILRMAKKKGWVALSAEKIALKAGNLITQGLAEEFLKNEQEISQETIINATAKAIADLTDKHKHILKKQRTLLAEYLEKLDTENLEFSEKMRLLKLSSECSKSIFDLERRIFGVDKVTHTNDENNNITISFV